MEGLGLGPQAKPCVRAVVPVALVTLVFMMYLMGTDLQMQLFRPAILPIYVDNISVPSKLKQTLMLRYYVFLALFLIFHKNKT